MLPSSVRPSAGPSLEDDFAAVSIASRLISGSTYV